MDLLNCKDIEEKDILDLFKNAEGIRKLMETKKQGLKADWETGCEDKIMAALFFEPSTRTRLSFEAAMLRLGGKVISVSGTEGSSCSKGETLADTLMATSMYADVLVVRSSEPCDKWTNCPLPVPIINAGDGPCNHPTQALLDAYTIWRHHGCPNDTPIIGNLTIGIVGDAAKSRTIASLIEIMNRKQSNRFIVYYSTGLKQRPHLDNRLCDIDLIKSESELAAAIPECDVLYLNRIQRERWDGIEFEPFTIWPHMWESLKRSCIVMNPGPRREELPERYDADPKNKIWEQVKNGLYLRMALLRKILCGRG